MARRFVFAEKAIDLSGKVKNADGYQYQIYDGTKVLANKNSANTTCILKKVPTMGFARVRSYTVQNGKKSYSRWSNEMRMPPVKLNKDNIKLIKIYKKRLYLFLSIVPIIYLLYNQLI